MNYIPLEEAALRLGLPVETLKTRLKRGQIDGVKVPLKEGSKRLVWAFTPEQLGSIKPSENDYDRLEEQYFNEMRHGSGVFRGKPVSAKHIRDMGYCLKGYWKRLKLEPELNRINAANFRKAMESYGEPDYIKRKDYFSSKIQMYKAITGFMRLLIRDGYKTQQDMDAIRAEKPAPRFDPVKLATPESDFKAALDANAAWGRSKFDQGVMEIILNLYAHAGLRRVEPGWLRMQDVFISDDYIRVYGKGCREGLVPIFPELREPLEKWLERRKASKVQSDWLIPQRDGSQMTESCFENRFKRFNEHLEEKKLNRVRPHDLRRAFATRLVHDYKLPLSVVQRILRHKKAETTEGYVLMTDALVMEAVKSIGKVQPVKASKRGRRYV